MSKHPSQLSRRVFVSSAATVAGGLAAARFFGVSEVSAQPNQPASLEAEPPAGFRPLSIPGRVVKVSAKEDFASLMQPNQLWPKPEPARRLLERAMTDFTGASNLVEAMKRFVHKDDVVAVKLNGIGGQKGQTMAVNFELILPVVEALLAVGVPQQNVTVYEQYPSYLVGCRVNLRDWKLPEGVKTGTHNNVFHTMRDITIYQGIKTRYCDFFTKATAVINMSLIKDHSICGYTGALKNITHGNINNPSEHHAHNASPQIAMLYNHPIVTSRVRLHITDAFKVIYDKGPLDRDPNTRIPHGAVYVSTDPVAMDVVGAQVVEVERKQRGQKTLADSRRPARYIEVAGELGLGIADPRLIRLSRAEI